MSEYNNKRQREWAKANPDKRKAISRRAYENNKEVHLQAARDWRKRNHARVLLAQCKRSKDCSLTLEDVERMLLAGVCSVTGLQLTLDFKGVSRRNPWAPSIDRLDNSRGYHPDNVRLVCCAFNIMRSDFSDDVVRTLARAVTENWND